jgi:hypothetical protein
VSQKKRRNEAASSPTQLRAEEKASLSDVTLRLPTTELTSVKHEDEEVRITPSFIQRVTIYIAVIVI